MREISLRRVSFTVKRSHLYLYHFPIPPDVTLAIVRCAIIATTRTLLSVRHLFLFPLLPPSPASFPRRSVCWYKVFLNSSPHLRSFLRFTIETHKQYTMITHSLFLFEFLIYHHRLHRTWCFHFDWFCCHLHNFFLSCNHNNRSPVNLPHVLCSWNHTRQAYSNRNQAKLAMTVTWSGIQHQLR